MRRNESIDILAEPTDIVEIETQYDERCGTVLYVHCNGVTLLRIQYLSKDSQLLNGPIEMRGYNKPKFQKG